MTLYHVAKPDGTRMGPYDETMLQSMLNDGLLTADCLVWTEGWTDWQSITTVATPPAADSTPAAWGPIVAFKSAVFGRYATFTGRASRSEFWWFYLAEILLFCLATFAIGFLVAMAKDLSGDNECAGISGAVGGVLLILAVLALIVPNISVTVRRLHDAGYSGWFYLLNFVPYVGGIILFIFALLPSAPPNQWGTGPDKPAK